MTMKPEDIREVPNNHVGIQFAANGGAVVSCGCATFVFSSLEEAFAAIRDYASRPREYEAAYQRTHYAQGMMNAAMQLGQMAMPAPMPEPERGL